MNVKINKEKSILITSEQITFPIEKLNKTYALYRYPNLGVDMYNSLCYDGMVVDFLTRLVKGEETKEKEEIYWSCKYPSSTFQHFKQDYFPKWLLKLFPVQYDTEYFNMTVEKLHTIKMCPHIDLTGDADKDQHCMYWLKGIPNEA